MMIGGKWKSMILYVLSSKGVVRFNQLPEMLDEVSATVEFVRVRNLPDKTARQLQNGLRVIHNNGIVAFVISKSNKYVVYGVQLKVLGVCWLYRLPIASTAACWKARRTSLASLLGKLERWTIST